MIRRLFVNLPVADLATSIAFYEALGAAPDPRFTDESAACMVLSDQLCVMLQTHDRFATFTDRRIADSHATVQVLNALSLDSRAEVSRVVERAGAIGRADPNPPQDYGAMYSRSVEDPDGHFWEVVWMAPAADERTLRAA